MILWFSGLGFISAFALGPATFNIIRNLIARKAWPWRSIAGFLLGDLIYIAAAVLLLRTSLWQIVWLKALLTSLTVLCLLLYSLKVLFPGKEQQEQPSTVGAPSFRRSFFLTLGNFHLVFIYAGLFVNLTENNLTMFAGVLAYLSAFIVSFFALLWVLRVFHGSLQQILRKIEVVAACGFLTFSIYLSMGIL
ncbi:hypothetical protein QJS83_11145 [Bdellovibrio sp. 22V]|uniref:hypothetical protein n=1 Tax=Bdellovibrio TaxID=958 RepID=UPI0025432D83|nr:hypothetical protein [Bdellovibrio sp. 22V]WII71017.1 hypothetical protein QJS83_11145 [Bdellovibrio sp. 22V]